MAEKRGWIVTISHERPIAEIAADLTAAGFSVEHVLAEIGSITGAAGEETVPNLLSIRGVASVSPDRAIHIGPGAGDTW